MTEEFEIRTMTPYELNIALEWAVAEGWNVGLRDAGCFLAADPKGFILGLLDGKPAGCVSAVSYGSDFGFLGLFIVRPELRGKGLGKLLWSTAVSRLKGRVAGLDAVVSREGMYESMGFKTAHRSTCNRVKARRTIGNPPGVRPLSKLPFEKACEFDRRFFPAERTAFLDTMVRTQSTHSFAYVTDGEIRGLGSIRECQGGWKIGPLYAETVDIAENLFDALQNAVPEGSDIYVNTPHCNMHAIVLAKGHNMAPVFDTVRMYKGPEPKIDKSGIYSLASFELG